ncbi:MAG TPA: CoA-acylating methylmalonate-semialdehyde dehydrogenase [Terriglobales bacterium]|nr:CoA-acylating methylmalonate-semialdehyde dehydrogenase [Terriglobales bacterium]
MTTPYLANHIAGAWTALPDAEHLPVTNPATLVVLAQVPMSPAAEVARAVEAAAAAFPLWREIPAGERIQCLFRLKAALEADLEGLAQTIVDECGKTLDEARAEIRRGIENVETGCGIPLLMQGFHSENVAQGIDETMLRQPLGVVAIVTPFNFPAMIPLWFLPYAIACGNTVVFKPSEKTPLAAERIQRLMVAAGVPPGVVNLVHGERASVEALLDHPLVRAVSFVGSTAVARQVYARAAAAGKRAQCQGGAKNAVVVLDDADRQGTRQVLSDSAYGCNGQRCLAASIAIAVGDARGWLTDELAAAARERPVGAVITAASKQRIESLIARGIDEGARAVVDGRGRPGQQCAATLLDEVRPDGTLAQTEIFGPVLSLIHAATLEQAIAFVNRQSYGNMACLFTSSGAAAREFKHEAQAGNIGINLGVAAPMAQFPFTGWKGSFFGDLHAQGRDAVEFYTDKKVVIERWPTTLSRTF